MSSAKTVRISATERGGYSERRQCQTLREDQILAELSWHGKLNRTTHSKVFFSNVMWWYYAKAAVVCMVDEFPDCVYVTALVVNIEKDCGRS